MTGPRDATRYYPSGTLQNPGLPPGVPCNLAGIVEHTRGTALFYWHPAETIVGHGPGCPLGHLLWNLAERLAADGMPGGQVRGPDRVPRQRKAS